MDFHLKTIKTEKSKLIKRWIESQIWFYEILHLATVGSQLTFLIMNSIFSGYHPIFVARRCTEKKMIFSKPYLNFEKNVDVYCVLNGM